MQVHITQGDYDGRAVLISWVAMDEAGPSRVQYGTSRKYGFAAEGASNKLHILPVQVWIYPSLCCRCSSGDLGQTYNSRSTLDHYMQSRAQAVLFVGDLSYTDRYQYNDVGIQWDSWGRFVECSTAYQPWIWTAGNHEIEYMPWMGEVVPFKSYLHRYATPHAASQSSTPLWYAIRRASAHIIMLSSYSPFVKYTPQYMWLYEELQRVDHGLLFLCMFPCTIVMRHTSGRVRVCEPSLKVGLSNPRLI
ncbi:Calcineurin-like phosphoesterase domain, ApaH type [Dillenia turbinata]|uniref:Purple acid phosphatase n=1 Tax=Dillenia turbinata TaxID=194707 RepID=A0AAN8VXN1_9MAGN